jgi:hypothetical protein
MATDRASKVEAVAPSLECATTAGHGRGKPIQEEGGSLAIVVLGASGDLAKKKTFPALFALFKQVNCRAKGCGKINAAGCLHTEVHKDFARASALGVACGQHVRHCD